MKRSSTTCQQLRRRCRRQASQTLPAPTPHTYERHIIHRWCRHRATWRGRCRVYHMKQTYATCASSTQPRPHCTSTSCGSLKHARLALTWYSKSPAPRHGVDARHGVGYRGVGIGDAPSRTAHHHHRRRLPKTAMPWGHRYTHTQDPSGRTFISGFDSTFFSSGSMAAMTHATPEEEAAGGCRKSPLRMGCRRGPHQRAGGVVVVTARLQAVLPCRVPVV